MFRLAGFTWGLRGVIGVNSCSFSRYFSTSSPVFESSKNDKFRPKGRRPNVPNDQELLQSLRALGIGGAINDAPSFEELTTFEVDDTVPKPSYDPDLEDLPPDEDEVAVVAGGEGGANASALTGGLAEQEQKEEESPLEKILQQTIDRNTPSRESAGLEAAAAATATSAASKEQQSGINLENMPKTIEEAENRAVDVMFELHHKRNSSSKLEARKFRQMMLKADRIEQSIIDDEYPPLEETPPTEKEFLEQYSKITDDDYRLYPPTFESELQTDSDEVKVGERSDKERELLEQLPADFRNDPELNTMESLIETSTGDSIRRLIRKVGDSHTRYRKTTLFQQDYNENKFIKDRLDMSKFTFKEMLKIGSHTKVTKGGRVNTVSVLIIVGDQNGTAGLGYGKGLEMMEAVDAATRDAFKHLVSIDRWEERTICGFLNAKVRTTKVYMWPLTKGEGTKSSPLAAAVFEAFGIDDVSCKIYPSNSVHNTVHALIKALTMSVHPETIAKSLGQKVFDVNNIRRSNGRTRAF